MGIIGSIIGELIMILGGLVSFLIYGGHYLPKFKTEKDKEKHLETIKNKGRTFSLAGLGLLLLGLYRLISKII